MGLPLGILVIPGGRRGALAVHGHHAEGQAGSSALRRCAALACRHSGRRSSCGSTATSASRSVVSGSRRAMPSWRRIGRDISSVRCSTSARLLAPGHDARGGGAQHRGQRPLAPALVARVWDLPPGATPGTGRRAPRPPVVSVVHPASVDLLVGSCTTPDQRRCSAGLARDRGPTAESRVWPRPRGRRSAVLLLLTPVKSNAAGQATSAAARPPGRSPRGEREAAHHSATCSAAGAGAGGGAPVSGSPWAARARRGRAWCSPRGRPARRARSGARFAPAGRGPRRRPGGAACGHCHQWQWITRARTATSGSG